MQETKISTLELRILIAEFMYQETVSKSMPNGIKPKSINRTDVILHFENLGYPKNIILNGLYYMSRLLAYVHYGADGIKEERDLYCFTTWAIGEAEMSKKKNGNVKFILDEVGYVQVVS